MKLPYFFFGTLMDQDVLERVLGRAPGPLSTAAVLHGYSRVRVDREPYPALVTAPGHRVAGLLLRDYSAEDDRRIRYFEDFDFAIEQTEVETEAGSETAHFCGAVSNITPMDEPWSYEEWVRTDKERFLRVTDIYMKGYGTLDAEAADRLWLDTVAELFGD
ncbi:gamma-glutamylcyclotransferase [Nisaea acidiphila]|uniref:Putative gamma-glutamylcyclotransferase n=1 Tax=Nisaea acidiphila TaxID=1862145 RepID=A0A9J7AQH7_9PROT|nr:gamma-glutamylcyclotransferase family protein [Nisaea acidiphila]UUX48612.1 gamma-glutamylcyclotransferase [Nisaea acidiphila]